MARRSENAVHGVDTDPGAELGLHNPVRDKEKLGDEQYSVTPPRGDVTAPADREGARCAQCSSELDPRHAYRVDGEEYAYYFCDVSCRDRWHGRDRGDTTSRQST